MKQLDTDTVLAIIKMIDNRINALNVEIDEHIGYHPIHLFGANNALKDLSNHLQEYIEGEISAMENSTAE